MAAAATSSSSLAASCSSDGDRPNNGGGGGGFVDAVDTLYGGEATATYRSYLAQLDMDIGALAALFSLTEDEVAAHAQLTADYAAVDDEDKSSLPARPIHVLKALCARKWEQERAIVVLGNYLRFMEEHGFHGAIDPGPFCDELGTGKWIPPVSDIDGVPCMFMKYGLHDPDAEPIEVMLGAIWLLMEVATSCEVGLREGVAMVADCNGLGWSNFNSEHEKMFTEVVTNTFPARIRHMTMFDTPFIWKAMMAIMRVFISKKLRQKIRVSGNKDMLTETLPPDQIPEEYGGENQVDVDGWLADMQTAYAAHMGR